MDSSSKTTPQTEPLSSSSILSPASSFVAYVAEGPQGDHGQVLRIESGSKRVGTSDQCDLVLHDSTISREHLMLSIVPEGIAVRDLDSTNGTYYLDQKVECLVLRSGGRLRIGRCTIDVFPASLSKQIRVPDRSSYGDLVGASVAIRRLYGLLERIEGSDVPVLIAGETGTGKDLVARAIHQHSPRADKPFLIVDCGNMQSELINAALFGYRKGAFTGAVSDRQGTFEAASGGTVMLDEIGELPLELQPKLLRVLETGEFVPIGDTRPIAVDVRVIAATHRDLADLVLQGTFRKDLYYRLAVVQVTTPALRDRRDDIPFLARHLAERLDPARAKALSQTAIDFLAGYDWPGNVRELRNAVQRLLLLGHVELDRDERDATPSKPPAAVELTHAAGGTMKYRDAKEAALREFERAYLESILQHAGGSLSRASRISGMDRKYLRDLLRRHGLYKGAP